VTETTPRSAGQLTRRLHSIPNNVTWESCPSSFTKLLPSAAAIEGLDDLYAISLESRRKPHKRLFPLAAGDYIGFALTILVLFIAAGGGIGGGGAIIPLYLLFLGFDASVAVALGNITIVGGSLSNFIFNAPRRHAFLNRPLIDWDLILVMEPATILGALIGGYVNKILPSWMTTVLLALLLTFISYKLLVRGFITWHSESTEFLELQNQGLHHDGQDGLEQPLLQDRSANPPTGEAVARSAPVVATRSHPVSNVDHHGESHSPLAYSGSFQRSFRSRPRSFVKDNPRLAQRYAKDKARVAAGSPDRQMDGLLEEGPEPGSADGDLPVAETRPLLAAPAEDGVGGLQTPDEEQKALDDRFAEARQIPPVRFSIMVLLTAVVALSDWSKVKVPCSSWQYWVLVLAIVPVVVAVTLIARQYLMRKRQLRLEAGYDWRAGDVEWNSVTTLTYPAICSMAGLIAGMFGVGGGIVKGPLMLELGILPDVASATAATMIVFTSTSASIVFLSFGNLPLNYAAAVFIVGIVFTMLGQVACYMLMRALGRRSVIVFAMAALMVLSVAVTIYESVIGIISATQHHHLWRFGHLCS